MLFYDLIRAAFRMLERCFWVKISELIAASMSLVLRIFCGSFTLDMDPSLFERLVLDMVLILGLNYA